jgi:hypothetical protein
MIDHVASFVGYVPASRPALVVLVSLDTPRGPRNEGGDVAAPVFARVAEQALLRMAVPPDEPDRVLHAAPYRPSNVIPAAYDPGAGGAAPLPAADPGVMPDVRGLSAREAALAAARLGLLVELHGSGRVVDQSPEAGAEIETGARCVLTLDRSS